MEIIIYKDFDKIIRNIGLITSKEDFIKIHKSLIDKFFIYDGETVNCDISFLNYFLNLDRGRTSTYKYSDGAIEFIKSKYLSDYFKDIFKKIFVNENISDNVKNILNSDTMFNDMTEKEISEVFIAVVDYFYKKNPSSISSVESGFWIYLLKLDGKGVMSFIKNNSSNHEIATIILETSGLSSRASFYSGRGVMLGDLNAEKLSSIFIKLFKLNEDYAKEFIKMLNNIKILSATRFITCFYDFANAGFKANSIKDNYSDVSVDGLYDNARDIVGFTSIYSILSKDDDNEIRLSNVIKNAFIAIIEPIANADNEFKEILNDLEDNSFISDSKNKM